MSITAPQLELYCNAVKRQVCELVESNKGPMLVIWLISKGYLEIHTIYEKEFGNIYKGPWDQALIDKLWITAKNIVFGIKAFHLISGDERLNEFIETFIEFQVSCFPADFDNIVERMSNSFIH
jgi:hypothetical protein